MRKYIITATLLIALASGSALTLHYIFVPAWVQKGVARTLISYGFANTKVRRIDTAPGLIKFHDMTLDQDEFSTIKELAIRYKTFTYLTSGTLESVTITAPELYADITPQQTFKITGLTSGLPDNPFANLAKIKVLRIVDGTLYIFENDLGSLSFSLKGESHLSASGHHEPQLTLKTAQKRFSASINIQGQIEKHGEWSLNYEVDNGGIETEDFSLNRITATINSSGTSLQDYLNTGEINVGSMRLGTTLWKNMNGTFETSPVEKSFLLSGDSTKSDGLEITLAYSTETPKALHYNLYGSTFQDLVNFAEENGWGKNIKWPDDILKMPDFSAQFDWKLTEDRPKDMLGLYISNYRYNITMEGQLTPNDGLTASISTAALDQVSLGENSTLAGGALSGTFSNTPKDDLKIALQSETSGKLNIAPETTALVFDTNTDQNKTTIEALENFEFQNIKVNIASNSKRAPKTKITMNGHNPDLFDGQNFTMTLDLKKDLATLLAPLANASEPVIELQNPHEDNPEQQD